MHSAFENMVYCISMCSMNIINKLFHDLDDVFLNQYVWLPLNSPTYVILHLDNGPTVVIHSFELLLCKDEFRIDEYYDSTVDIPFVLSSKDQKRVSVNGTSYLCVIMRPTCSTKYICCIISNKTYYDSSSRGGNFVVQWKAILSKRAFRIVPPCVLVATLTSIEYIECLYQRRLWILWYSGSKLYTSICFYVFVGDTFVIDERNSWSVTLSFITKRLAFMSFLDVADDL